MTVETEKTYGIVFQQLLYGTRGIKLIIKKYIKMTKGM